MKCRICRKDNPAGHAFCGHCGAALVAGGGAAPAADPPAGEGSTGGEAEEELLGLLRQGRKLEAIKAYRAATGAGLKEAKDAVESLAAAHNIVAAPSSGCGTTATLVALVSLAAVLLWFVVRA